MVASESTTAEQSAGAIVISGSGGILEAWSNFESEYDDVTFE
jgi:hypothetical protein